MSAPTPSQDPAARPDTFTFDDGKGNVITLIVPGPEDEVFGRRAIFIQFAPQADEDMLAAVTDRFTALADTAFTEHEFVMEPASAIGADNTAQLVITLGGAERYASHRMLVWDDVENIQMLMQKAVRTD